MSFVNEFSVKYMNYIGDGDSKIIKALLNVYLYGEDITLKNSEYMGYVKERTSMRLKNT